MPPQYTSTQLRQVHNPGKNYPAKCGEDGDGEVRIGGMWFIDEDGEEVTMQEPPTSGHNWS